MFKKLSNREIENLLASITIAEDIAKNTQNDSNLYNQIDDLQRLRLKLQRHNAAVLIEEGSKKESKT